MKPLLTVKNVSELLGGIAPGTVYEWCALRQIPRVKVGRRTMFDPVEIERWLEQRRVQIKPSEDCNDRA